MTKEEAIEYLKADIKHWENTSVSTEHLEMAIKALEQPTCDDCVSRQAVIEYIKACGAELGHDIENEIVREDILNMPPVTPTHGTCKDCKHWKDSDGVYRRGIGAESKCPINIKEVYEGNFYCKWFEERGDLDGGN